MKVLLTNDDGIDAPGIQALHTSLQGLGELTVVPPAPVQSATSHGVTFRDPLRSRQASPPMDGIAIDGRPADCVRVALRRLWIDRFGEGARPDVTISGLNSGANVGINIIYSGTVAAAMESAFHGVPAIAVSLHIGDPARTCFDRAAELARHAIDKVLEHPLDPHGVVNINIPRTESEDAPVPPIKVVAMNTATGIDNYEQRSSPSGEIYFWPTGNGMEFTHTASESDVEALFERFITVTPLSYDVTDHARMQSWHDRLQG